MFITSGTWRGKHNSLSRGAELPNPFSTGTMATRFRARRREPAIATCLCEREREGECDRGRERESPALRPRAFAGVGGGGVWLVHASHRESIEAVEWSVRLTLLFFCHLQGLKIAVVVNDVAKVNIDSKLVRERTGTVGDENMADCVELQNGCACCNASDELLQVPLFFSLPPPPPPLPRHPPCFLAHSGALFCAAGHQPASAPGQSARTALRSHDHRGARCRVSCGRHHY